MNSKYTYFILVFALVLFTNCNSITEKKITAINDYENYLDVSDNETLNTAIANDQFWSEKLEKSPNQFPYHGKLAGTYAQYFSATGDIKYLKKSEAQLILVNEKTNYNQPSYLRSLAHNYISQHRFKEALDLLTKSELLGENLQSTRKMLFDVHLELGNYDLAKMYLTQFENFSDFDYLIRFSKWSDHKGDLDSAIKYMEKAMVIADASNLKGLKQWTYTNIADYYGHAGDIEKSYNHYLKALEIDPNDAYSKKGIAWIVYSYEKNPDEALRILNSITNQNQAPDYFLLKADIADFKGDNALKEEQIALYKTAVKNEAYGDMYNKYNILLYTDENVDLDTAISMAEIEVANRPTPQSYDLLAWSHFKDGNLDVALQIVNTYVINKTYEPETLYHIAEIYKAAGLQEQVKPLKKELLASIYELGPTMEAKILSL